MSKLVAGEAKNHQAPGKAALQLVEVGEVPGGCSSERGHVLNQHGPASESVEVYLLPIQADSSESGCCNIPYFDHSLQSSQLSVPFPVILHFDHIKSSFLFNDLTLFPP